MSALLPKPSSFGPDITFWRFYSAYVLRDINNTQIRAVVAGYADEAAFTDGKSIMQSMEYVLDGPEINAIINNVEGSPITLDQVFAMCYQKIMADPFFAGAVKV